MHKTVPALAVLSACGVFGPDQRVEFKLERTGFTAPAIVSFTIRNGLSEPISIPRCGDRVKPEVERLSGGEWVNAAAAICQANLSTVPIQLNPGASVRDSVYLRDLGHYRLRTGIQTFASSDVILSSSFSVH